MEPSACLGVYLLADHVLMFWIGCLDCASNASECMAGNGIVDSGQASALPNACYEQIRYLYKGNPSFADSLTHLHH